MTFDIIKRLPLLFLICAPTLAVAKPTILIFGDSLSAGYGIAVEQSWPQLLTARLADAGLDYAVANASISGETTAGGRTRLPEALQRFRPAVLVLALGANDGLRGLPATQTHANLAAMIRAAKHAKARVLLVGMKLPPNYGTYARTFETTFRDVADSEHVALLPFLLAPIATDLTAFQADGVHPNATAQPKIVDHLWPALRPLLRQAR